MAVALKFCCVLLLLNLAACVKTEIPGYGADRPAIYMVQRGDTLYEISKRVGIDYRVLARRNHIPPPYTIYTGQRLYLSAQAPSPSYMPVATAARVGDAGQRISRAPAGKKAAQATKGKKAAAETRSVRLHWPLEGKVIDNFGRHGSRLNDGIDIEAVEGAPVHAAAEGDVVYADQRLSGYGKLIIIRHRRDLFTAYAHNQRNLVRKGVHVHRGDIIARVGKSGRARTPRLHFEVRRGPTPVDPLAYLPRR